MTDPALQTTAWDVIVIGAGLAGMTSAYHLTKTRPGCKVLVLEAKDRVGGRTLTVPLKGAHGTDDWDMGGQWVCRTQHHALWLLRELGIEMYPQYCKGTKLIQSGGSPKVGSYEGDIPALPTLTLLDVYNFETRTDHLCKYVDCETPWKAEYAERYDGMTFEEFIDKETWTAGAKELVDSAYEVVSGMRSRSHSALNYLVYTRSGISNQSLYDNKNGGAQESKIKGGAQPLSRKLAERVGQSNVLLSEPVASIDQGAGNGEVRVQTLSGKTFTCKYVINAIPPNCDGAIQYLPDIPTRRKTLISYMRMGNLVKFIVTFKTAFWKEKGFSGEVININHQSPDGEGYVGPLLYVADATTTDNNPALVGFINNALHWGNKPTDELKAAILEHLAVFFGPQAKTPIDFHVKDWAREPYVGGCPVNMAMPGAGPYWDALRQPFNRVHWAGTETATQWIGYLSGAIQSGLRAADEVTARLNGSPSADQPMTTFPKSDLLASLDELGKQDREPAPTGRAPGGSWLRAVGRLGVGVAIGVVGVAVGMCLATMQ